MVSGGHPYDQPSEFSEVFSTLDFVGEEFAGGSVVIAVVLDGQHDVLPAHVEVVPTAAIEAPDGNLGPRPSIPVANEHQPQPRLPRRLSSGIDEIECLLELSKPAGVAMPGGQFLDVADLELCGSGQSVQASDCIVEPTTPSKIESGALRRRHEEIAEPPNFVVEQ